MAIPTGGLVTKVPPPASYTPKPAATPSSPYTSGSPYQGGLRTDFGNLQGPSFTQGQTGEDDARTHNSTYMNNLSGANASDSDVIQANYQAWQLQNHPEGMDTRESQALYDMYEGRIGEKNSLAEQIAGSGDQLNQAQDINKATAGSTLDQGLKNTRSNFNGRGLLYSGMRQGGEQSVKNSVASQLASSMTGTARDSANSVTAAKNAYASVDLANQQDTLNRANQAFDTASANNIARLQAMQQLGSGVGSAAGTIAGNAYSPNGPSYQNPASGWNPGVTSDGSNSYFSSGPSQGLLAGNQNRAAVGE